MALAGISGLLVGISLFAISFAAMFPFEAWYAACSGEGPWLGMLYGALIGGIPFAAIAYSYHQRWRARQKQWPRWERMRTLRQRTSLNLTELSTLPTNSSSSETPTVSEPRRTSHLPESEFTVPPPVGESGEET
jgi:hypothetical protein